jgi:hypothetical protein
MIDLEQIKNTPLLQSGVSGGIYCGSDAPGEVNSLKQGLSIGNEQ